MFVLFNKEKKFIGYSPDLPDSSNILKIKIPDEQSNLSMWKWEGDYENGGMVLFDIGYPIEEIKIERELFDYINQKYPLEMQIFNIVKQLRQLVQHKEDLQDDDFMDMSDVIVNAIQKYHKRVEFYENYANLISKTES